MQRGKDERLEGGAPLEVVKGVPLASGFAVSTLQKAANWRRNRSADRSGTQALAARGGNQIPVARPERR